MPDISKCTKMNHGEVDYKLTQFLTGNGVYRSYLYVFGLDDSYSFPKCDGVAETAEWGILITLL